MLTGVTAWHPLVVTGVRGGDTLLVHGAGGVGVLAIQLAAGRGARVVATASPASHDLLRELGAMPVSYGNGLAGRVRAAAPQGIDVAVDTVGTDISLELVADRSRIVTITAFARCLELGIKVIGADPGTEIRQAARLDLAQRATSGSA
jgi:NADPH:quinone reductase